MFVCICLVNNRHILLNIVLLQNCAIKNTGLMGNMGLWLEHSKTLSVIHFLKKDKKLKKMVAQFYM